jgi:GMP synthase (glutamine-hydrolysing)
MLRSLALHAVVAAGLALAIRLLVRRRGASLRAVSSSRLRCALISCADAPKWSAQMDLYVRAFDVERAFEWREYRAWLGELPDLDGVDVIFISGSAHCITDAPEVVWMRELLGFLERAAARERVRLIGICFGCQAIALALGGTVGRNPSGAFAYGVERLAPTHDFSEFPAALVAQQEVRHTLGSADNAPLPSAPRVLESHGQCVHVLPPRSMLLASSASAAHELFAVGANVLCMQYHPEFSVAVLEDKIAPALLAKSTISEAEHREAVRRFAREYDATWAADALFARALVTAYVRAPAGGRAS